MAQVPESCLSYNSVKLIRVRNTPLALVYYTVTTLLFLYVVVYSVVFAKGYQEYESLVGSSMIKVKGSAHTGTINGNDFSNVTIFDAEDLVMPPLQPDTVFVTSNFVLTPNQQRNVCEGNNPSEELCNCSLGSLDLCCPLGQHTDNGMKTGTCGPNGFCNLLAWCPLEVDPPNPTLNILQDVRDFTVFVRVNIRFPKFDVTRTNIDVNETTGEEQLSEGYNLWTIDELVNNTGTTWSSIAETGGIVVIQFTFNCDLNHATSECRPDISYFRLDSTDPNSISVGFNYRYVDEYRDINNTQSRDLYKVYGTQVIVQTFGTAGKFSIVALLLTLGAGLGLLGVSTIICDLVMQYIIPNHHKYVDEKYQKVNLEEDEKRALLSLSLQGERATGGSSA